MEDFSDSLHLIPLLSRIIIQDIKEISFMTFLWVSNVMQNNKNHRYLSFQTQPNV